MKESNHKSQKRSDESHHKKSNGHCVSSRSHSNVLRNREGSPDRNRRDNHKSSSEHNDKNSRRHRSPSPRHRKKEGEGDAKRHKSKKQQQRHKEAEESYEELSRKKRKIESELQALDLEEAAARREADEKRRVKGDASNGRSKIKVKEEPMSDGEKSRNHHRREKMKNRALKREPDAEQLNSGHSDEVRWGNSETEGKKPEKMKEKPNFAPSGKLAEDTNTFNGVVIKYNEPAEARKPRRKWRLYPFKGDSDLPFIPIHRQSAYLLGRTRKIADIPIDHPSCSKQHAVLQYRMVSYKREDGTTGRRVRPYIIDLESSNGTFVNNQRIECRKYVELMEKDVIKFGFSSREYVVLHEESKNDEEDDDVIETNST